MASGFPPNSCISKDIFDDFWCRDNENNDKLSATPTLEKKTVR